MMNNKEINITTFNLLQPYLLTEKELIEILRSRCLDENLNSCTKEELVELFKRVALPLPQREYGSSQREKRLSQHQKRRNKKIIRIDDSGRSKAPDSHSQRKTYKILETKSPPLDRPKQITERLRPPPDLVNYKRKIIKLNESSKKMIRSEIDKIVIINRKKETGSSSARNLTSLSAPHLEKGSNTSSINGRVLVSTNSNPSEIVSNSPETAPKVVKLKRDHLGPQKESGISSEVKGEESPQKKKRQKIVISW